MFALDCDYCFHRNKKTDWEFSRMEVIIFEKFICDLAELLEEKEEVEVIWHGGEPLVRGLDFYGKVIDIAAQYSKGKRINHCLQTNGMLINQSWAKFFKVNDFKVGVSIDGPEAFHDVFRKTKERTGSFSKVIAAIELLQGYEIPLGIVVVVHAVNAQYPKEIFDFAKHLGVKKIQISPCVETEDGSRTSFSVKPKEFARFICKIYDLWVKEGDAGIEIGYVNDIVDTFLGMEARNCILSDNCHGFLVLEANGDIKPCEDLFGEKAVFGNITQNSLGEIVSSVAYKSFYERISTKRKYKCGECEWFEICRGGCPHQWKSFKTGKTILCESNKIIFQYIAESIQWLYSRKT